MNGRAPFSPSELAAAFDEPRLATLRVLHLAIPAGALLLVAVALALAVDPPQGSPAPGLPLLLGGLTAALTVGSWAVAFRVHAVMLSGAVRSARSPEELPTALQTARLLRLALLEAPALLGGVTLLLAALDGSLRSQPLLLLAALPAFALAAFVWTSWPRRDALVEEIAAVEREERAGPR